MDLYDQIQEAATAIRTKWAGKPKVGIILGTGLGGLVEEVQVEASIPYGEIPHFPVSTAPSHKGRLVCGQLSGKTVMAMEGRFHYYEGYSLQQITLPVRVMKALGCDTLIVSNACGGMNPQWGKGDLMLIEDHINLLGDNPLIGPNDERLGPRFPDMCQPYDRELLARWCSDSRLDEKIVCHQGVFVAVSGPNLETRAEYRFLRPGRRPTWSACPLCPRSSSAFTAACVTSAFRSSPTCVCPMRWSRPGWKTLSPWRTRRRRNCVCWCGGWCRKSFSREPRERAAPDCAENALARLAAKRCVTIGGVSCRE